VAGQEDVVHLEAGVAAEEALEVIVVVEALEVAEALEDSVTAAAVVVVAEDSGEVVVVSEGHDIPEGLRLVARVNLIWPEGLAVTEPVVHMVDDDLVQIYCPLFCTMVPHK
jgi:hypothetical protein